MAFYDDEPRQLDLDDLVEAAEPNPLLRRVDALCDARAWDDLVQLARRCREAYERGKQLWPIAEHIDDDELHRALLGLAGTWVTGSSGRAEAAVVEGGVAGAIGNLGARSFLIGEIQPREALALMAWAAASGGAHGRRRGAAAGRSAAWWAVAELSGLDWPPDPDELAREIGRLRWYRWEPHEMTVPLPGALRGASVGWNLHLAVEDPD